MAATVTIDQTYFETLLRRAEFHTSGRDISTPVNIPLVTIPKIDHDNLLRMAQEYTSLRDALFNGGIDQDALETLIRFETTPLGQLNEWDDGEDPAPKGPKLFSRPQPTPVSISRPHDEPYEPRYQTVPRWGPSSSGAGGGTGYNKGNRGFSRHNSSGQDHNSFTPDFKTEDTFLPAPRPERPYYQRNDQRTIIAKNLSERATHKDITEFIRGGNVLDIYLRTNEKSASISFVEGAHAQAFMNYTKRNDIYVHGKRLEWEWNERQFILPGHVANKIGLGATRNLVIRGVASNITAEKISEDLDHIHNVVIIDITFANGDCHIFLNSIHNSLFARTCMMSRASYKGMKIEWYPDECAQPLPQPRVVQKEIRPPPPKKKAQPMNRYQMLGMDGDDSEDGEDEDVDETAVTEMSTLSINPRAPWSPSSVAT